jgi:hypothetical protein
VRAIRLVYLSNWQLFYQIGDANNTWTNPVLIGSADYFTRPALVPNQLWSGSVILYYRDSGSSNLVRRQFDVPSGSSTGSWSAVTTELTTANAPIPVLHGVGAVIGASAGSTWTYAAIPDPANGAIRLYRYDWLPNNRWTELTDAFPSGQVFTDGAPALAYVPFNSSSPLEGQFYLAFDPSAATDSGNLRRIMKTEGNGPSSNANRRFQFRTPHTVFGNEWSWSGGSPALFFENGVDENLRAAWTWQDAGNGGRDLNFAPVADGIPNVPLKDQDDYRVVRGTLSCSLGASTCPPGLL